MSRRDTDDDAPWLAEAEPRVRERTTVSRASMFWTIIVLLTLAAVAVVGTVVLLAKKEGGSTAGYMEADQAPLITAETGPYKVRPGDPQGLAVDGEGQTIYATGEGGAPASALDPDGAPEEPLLRPGSAPVAEGGMSTGASPGGPTDLIPSVGGAGTAMPPAAATPPSPAAAVPPVARPPVPVSAHAAKADAKPVKPREPLKIDIPKDPVRPDARTATDAKTAAAAKPVAETGKAADLKRADPKPAEAKPKSATRAQLGAFKTPQAADAAWAAAGSATSGFSKRIEPVETAGGTLYRLRATGGDAAALCARLAAKGAACKAIE